MWLRHCGALFIACIKEIGIGSSLRVALEERGFEECAMTDVCLLQFFACPLKVERRGSAHLCFAVCGWSFCKMLRFEGFFLGASHSTVEALSLVALLPGMWSSALSDHED